MTARDAQQRYIEQCAQYIGGALGLEPAAILGRSRMYMLALARHLIIYRLRTFGWTQTDVGLLLHMDHSSVSNAEHRIPRVLVGDSDLAAIYDGMPLFGGAVFSDVNLLELFQRLSQHVAAAQELRARIEAAIAQQDIPQRVSA